MPCKLTLDPNLPIFFDHLDNCLDYSKQYQYGKAVHKSLRPIFDEQIVFDQNQFATDSLDVIKKGRKAYKSAVRNRELLALYKDIRFSSVYFKSAARAGAKNAILKGGNGLRELNTWRIKGYDDALQQLIRKTSSMRSMVNGKNILLDTGFEVAELGIDLSTAYLEGRSLSTEEIVTHAGDLFSVAVGASATALTYGALIAVASISSSLAVPVIALVVVPVTVGSLAKSGYQKLVKHQLNLSKEDMTTPRQKTAIESMQQHVLEMETQRIFEEIFSSTPVNVPLRDFGSTQKQFDLGLYPR